MTHVAVVGGGLAGLSAAYALTAGGLLARGGQLTLLEAGPRLGGGLGTVSRDGYVMEVGADSILSEKPAALDLARRLGLGDRIIGTRDEHRGALVVRDGALHRVPEGFSLMAPTRARPWMRSNVVSLPGRLRALAEPLVPARRAQGEESLASFVRRRFGVEVFERLAQPLVGGIYGADPEQLSLEETMPRFVALEREHGSVLAGLRARADRRAGGARYALFQAFDGGMQVLVEALTDALRSSAGEGCVRTGERVTSLSAAPQADGRPAWRVATASAASGQEAELTADAVVLAVPAPVAADVLRSSSGHLSAELRRIPYGSIAIATLAYDAEALDRPLGAFGFVVPSVERRPIAAATFSHMKWPGRAPKGKALFRVFVGGAHAADSCDWPDERLLATAHQQLSDLAGVRGEPEQTMACRFRGAMPQYVIGHRRRVETIERLAAKRPGLYLAGNAYRGVGLGDTVRHAESAAARLLRDTSGAA